MPCQVNPEYNVAPFKETVHLCQVLAWQQIDANEMKTVAEQGKKADKK